MNRDEAIHELRERYQQAGRSLNELQRRLWAATEAIKLGRGGISVVSKALRISPNTIKRGIHEIESGQSDSQELKPRIRKPGGGRKSKVSVEKDSGSPGPTDLVERSDTGRVEVLPPLLQSPPSVAKSD